MRDLSILIPARNEMFLARTVEDLLKNKRGNTEVLVGLDGEWADPSLADHDDLTILYCGKSIGQRAITNQLCRLSHAKYVMKIDAHCSVDEGFDLKMMAEMHDDWTMAPMMYNFHVFDWVCYTCGNRKYQGPTPDKCEKCGDVMAREMIWKPRRSRMTCAYRFDRNLHFQYWGDYKKRQTGDIVESLSLQGSCWMLTREKYWELNVSDEGHGGWGQQGTEVACKTWLSGGKVMINKKTWYAHMFRTQGGDFGFPYTLSGKEVDKARKYSRSLFVDGNWKAKYDLNWLLTKFYPVPDWHDEKKPSAVSTGANLSTSESKSGKTMVFYTDNRLNVKIAHAVQKNLLKISKEKGIPIVSVSLKPMSFGRNVCLSLSRGYIAMARQILVGLETTHADIVYLCEHDVLYHPSHFDFTPIDRNVYYYNTNVWRVRSSDGHALYCDNLHQLSGLVAFRYTLKDHFRKRVKRLEEKRAEIPNDHAFNRYIRQVGFEPGTHNRPDRIDDLPYKDYFSEHPNIDIRHEANLTPSRWNKDQFRNERYTEGWTEAETVPPWNWKKGEFLTFLTSL